jgi:hypothetical protein
MGTQQQERQQSYKLPPRPRPIIIVVALFFFAIAAVTWIWKIWGDWAGVMTAIFTISGTVSAFFAIPFLYSSSDSSSSSAHTDASSQQPAFNFTPSITVSPNITVFPNQNISQQSTTIDTKLPQSTIEKSLAAPTNIQPSQQLAPRTEQAEVKPAQAPSDTVFLVNLPLTDPNEFSGRMLERTKLLSRTRKGACTSIVGPRRIGKSWLISYLRLVASTQLGINFHIGYLDVTMPSCTSVHGFTTEVLKVLGFPFFSTLTNPDLTTLEGFVKDMVARNQAPILCIDEFEGFASHQQDFDFNFFTGLRAITQVGLGLVVVSKNPLIDIVSENTKTSPFFNVFLQLKLEPFGVEDAEKFAQVKSAQAGLERRSRNQAAA